MFFQCEIKKPFGLNTSTSKNNIVSFSMWDLKPFRIYTLCFQEKNHVFSMWDKKPFGLNIST